MGDGQISFSQKYGYEEIPRPLNLEELPKEARTRIWNLFYDRLGKTTRSGDVFETYIGPPWDEIFHTIHTTFYSLPLDEWDPDFEHFRKKLRERILSESIPFNKVFDLIQCVMRHPLCPRKFITRMRNVFSESRLAYTLDFGPPPTIVPAVTAQEGAAIVESLQSLRKGGLDASVIHLGRASTYINEGKWADSVRESIHAVESVARQLDPNAAKTLGPALNSINRQRKLHPAFQQAFERLYGYTNDEQGIRHPLLDQADAEVGQDEAVFMLGACASFASYLLRKHETGAPA